MNLKEGAGKLKSDVPALAMALKDAGTPTATKTLAGITVAYALSPIDLIPDFVPLEENRKKAEGMWENEKPKRWYYAIPVVCIWAVVMVCVAKILLG